MRSFEYISVHLETCNKNIIIIHHYSFIVQKIMAVIVVILEQAIKPCLFGIREPVHVPYSWFEYLAVVSDDICT